MALYYIYRRSLMCHGLPCIFLVSITTVLIVELYGLGSSPDNIKGNLCSHKEDPHAVGTPTISSDINKGGDQYNNLLEEQDRKQKFRHLVNKLYKETMGRRPLNNRYDDDGDPASSGQSKSEPLFVVVLAQMRTGSSVIGQILNQNKNMFYMYEPLHVIQDWQSGDVDLTRFRDNNEVITEILGNISQCRFSEDFVRSYGGWGGRTKCSALMPLCEKARVCSKLDSYVFEKICSSLGGQVATKLIRAGLDHLKPLVEEDRSNVKVIHLVRDPRGTANSRLDYYVTKGVPIPVANGSNGQQGISKMPGLSTINRIDSNETIFSEVVVEKIQTLCRWMTTNVRTALSKPAWLRGRYMVVRYEDFAEEPLTVAKDIYRFLGRPVPHRVLSWIRNNTKDNQDYDYVRHRLYSMHRNASATASKWRTGLKRKEAIHIQSVCSEAMGLLGYKLIGPDTDITDLSIPLIKPLRLPLP